MARPTPAFTLLEVLLSSVVLASMSALIGVMWTHARTWTTGAESSRDALAVPRILNLLQQQWSARRVLTRGAAPFHLEPGSISIVTTEPLLFPDCGFVRATYSTTAPSPDAAHSLRYTERPVVDLLADAPGSSSLASGHSGETVILLDRCDALDFSALIRGPPNGAAWTPLDDQSPAEDIVALRLSGRHQGAPFSCTLVNEASRSRSY